MLPSQPKNNVVEQKSVAVKQTKISLISAKDIDREMTKGKPVIILTAREVPKESITSIPCKVALVIDEFVDVFPEDLLDQLPSMRDIQYAIDLVPEASLPNLPHYRMNLTEHAELESQRIVEGFYKGKHEPLRSACSADAKKR